MSRFLIYSHDTYGLGHFRRCVSLAEGLVSSDEGNEILIVTGSPRPQAFTLPERVDTVKLPSVTKNGSGRYEPRKLGVDLNRLVRIRSDLILATANAYEPDVFLVDHAPAGMCGELGPALRSFDSPANQTRLVLGLRDIVDDAARVDAEWHRSGVWDAVGRYDTICVYGDGSIATTALELDLASRTEATVEHVGYVAPAMPGPLPGDPYLLVTVGGGGDGHPLIRRVLDAVDAGATRGMRTVIVAGPLLSASRRAELMLRSEQLPSVDFVTFAPNLRSLIVGADAVISMAGYNTVVELLAAGTPALLVPRSHPRLEQELRASRLAAVTSLQHCSISALNPARIRSFLESCRSTTVDIRCELDLTGVATMAASLSDAAEAKPVARRV